MAYGCGGELEGVIAGCENAGFGGSGGWLAPFGLRGTGGEPKDVRDWRT